MLTRHREQLLQVTVTLSRFNVAAKRYANHDRIARDLPHAPGLSFILARISKFVVHRELKWKTRFVERDKSLFCLMRRAPLNQLIKCFVLISNFAVLIQLEAHSTVAKSDDVFLGFRTLGAHSRERLDVWHTTIETIDLILRLRPRRFVREARTIICLPHRRQFQFLSEFTASHTVATPEVNFFQIVTQLLQIRIRLRLAQLHHELIGIKARVVTEGIPRLRRTWKLTQFCKM